MSEELKLSVTCEEGNTLFQLAAAFSLPEKLGDQNFAVADRAIAGDEVRSLYRALKAYSPMTLKPERWRLFGPLDNFKDFVDERGQKGHQMIDLAKKIEIKLDEEAISGAMWCLLVAVHPSSQMCLGVQSQNEIVWPIATKLGRTRAIRDLVGYQKGTPRRWKIDEDYDKDEKKPEEKK